MKVALACVMLALSGLVSGRFTLFPRQSAIEVDGVVTSVERVQYRLRCAGRCDSRISTRKETRRTAWTRSTIRRGRQVTTARAVYRPKTPNLATLQAAFGVRPGSDRGQTKLRPGPDHGLSASRFCSGL